MAASRSMFNGILEITILYSAIIRLRLAGQLICRSL
jgi:hypothetical protein